MRDGEWASGGGFRGNEPGVDHQRPQRLDGEITCERSQVSPTSQRGQIDTLLQRPLSQQSRASVTPVASNRDETAVSHV